MFKRRKFSRWVRRYSSNYCSFCYFFFFLVLHSGFLRFYIIYFNFYILISCCHKYIVSEGITSHENSHEGEIMFAIRSYIAENEDALDLVEGEKVYVIGKNIIWHFFFISKTEYLLLLIILESQNQEWWFVKKHLTEEKGWVPSIYLRDETSYMKYVQKKLHEKIDKLPIFQSKRAKKIFYMKNNLNHNITIV